MMQQIRQDLSRLADREVVLYGSTARGEATVRSDIDVAVITRTRDRVSNMSTWQEVLGGPNRYDVRIFELLPIHIQADIVENHRVVFGDPLQISEYFYPIRRQWGDVKHRFEKPLPPRERLRRLQEVRR